MSRVLLTQADGEDELAFPKTNYFAADSSVEERLIARIIDGDTTHQLILILCDELPRVTPCHHVFPQILTLTFENEVICKSLSKETGHYTLHPFVTDLIDDICFFDFKNRPLYLEAKLFVGTKNSSVLFANLTYQVLREYFGNFLNIDYGNSIDSAMHVIFETEDHGKAALKALQFSRLPIRDRTHFNLNQHQGNYVLKISLQMITHVMQDAIKAYQSAEASKAFFSFAARSNNGKPLMHSAPTAQIPCSPLVQNLHGIIFSPKADEAPSPNDEQASIVEQIDSAPKTEEQSTKYFSDEPLGMFNFEI